MVCLSVSVRVCACACASPLLQLPPNVEVGDASKDQRAAGDREQEDGVPLEPCRHVAHHMAGLIPLVEERLIAKRLAVRVSG